MDTERGPFTIGLLGGIASGKSFVAALLEERGAKRFDADKLAHEVLDAEDVRAAIQNELGDEVFNADGRVDRPRMAQRVFGDAEARAFLERLIHPRVGLEIVQGLMALRAGPGVPRAVAVLDVPLLLEAGLGDLCNELWYVDADLEVRLRRAATRGWDGGELERREAAQTPLAEKRDRASAQVPNHGDAEETRAVVHKLWEERVEVACGPEGETR